MLLKQSPYLLLLMSWRELRCVFCYKTQVKLYQKKKKKITMPIGITECQYFFYQTRIWKSIQSLHSFFGHLVELNKIYAVGVWNLSRDYWRNLFEIFWGTLKYLKGKGILTSWSRKEKWEKPSAVSVQKGSAIRRAVHEHYFNL